MSRVSKMAVAVALVAVGAGGAKGADGDASASKAIDQAAIERSWAIQAELARIEGNKEAFVDELLGSWAAQLDRDRYDVQRELKPIAMEAYPWRLYGASLVGDFKTMVGVLRGKIGAAQYVNTLTQPQPRAGVVPNALGAGTDSLVFTPIAPCRIVDTRGTGARTGILNPGAPRVFDLTTDGFTAGQGGDTSCAGLPAFSHYGWAANVSVTGFSTSGNLRTFPFGGTVPNASFLNFFPGATAIANAGTLTGCFACAGDVTFQAFGGPTHVIIDVMGYYEQATGFFSQTAALTNMVGTTTTIPINTAQFVSGGICPAGTTVVSGGQSNSGTGVNAVLTADHVVSGATWQEYLRNPNTAATVTATVFTRCIDN